MNIVIVYAVLVVQRMIYNYALIMNDYQHCQKNSWILSLSKKPVTKVSFYDKCIIEEVRSLDSAVILGIPSNKKGIQKPKLLQMKAI